MSLPKNISHWSLSDVAHWLEENHFQSLVQKFKEHEIDGKALTLLQNDDITELITIIGPRVKFRAKINQLFSSRNINPGKRYAGHHDAPSDSNLHATSNQRYNFIQMYPQPNQQQIMSHVRYQPIENVNQNGVAANKSSCYNSNVKPLNQYNYAMYPVYDAQQNIYKVQQAGQQNVIPAKNSQYAGQQNNPHRDRDRRMTYARPHAHAQISKPQGQYPIKNNESYHHRDNAYHSYHSKKIESDNNDVTITKEINCDFIKKEPLDLDNNNNNNDQTRKENGSRDNCNDQSKSSESRDENSNQSRKTSESRDENEMDFQSYKEYKRKESNEVFPGDEEDKENFFDSIPERDNSLNNDLKTQVVTDNVKETACINAMHQNSHCESNENMEEDLSTEPSVDFDLRGFNESHTDSSEIMEPNSNIISMINVHSTHDHQFSVELPTSFKKGVEKHYRHENKSSIESVTNRLALRERSKIFRRSEKKWHIAVNETAYRLVKNNPKLLQNKKELRSIAEAEVRKTYRFAKGKSRSIAIPENRIAAEERKKQRMTQEKLSEIKRRLNAEGEDISRKMRQCHMNLTLASQQSDATKTLHLREEMRRLSQCQAKLHFKMDEILAKERKLTQIISANHITEGRNSANQSPEEIENFEQYETNNDNDIMYLQPNDAVDSVHSSTPSQVHVDEHGRVIQLPSSNASFVYYDGDNVSSNEIVPVVGLSAFI